MPLQINKWKLNTSLEAKLNNRAVALRNPRERATFRIQEGITRGFRDFLYNNGFTEIHTPKLGAKSAEEAPTSSSLNISIDRLYYSRARSFTSR